MWSRKSNWQEGNVKQNEWMIIGKNIKLTNETKKERLHRKNRQHGLSNRNISGYRGQLIGWNKDIVDLE